MRLDIYLCERGLVQSRQRAKTLIESGSVTVDGVVVSKPAFILAEDAVYNVAVEDRMPYVGRGGYKLAAALDAFAVDPTDATAVDIGASTGGFTDCLLQRGATRVYAVDAGENQLAKKLREDPRVISIEHLNARTLSPEHLDHVPIDLAVMDVSFISATYILPQIPSILSENGAMICLIKPQFEVGRAMLGKGGIVKDRTAHEVAILRVLDCAEALGLMPHGLIVSPIAGGDGNREFLVYLRRRAANDTPWTRQDVRVFLKKI